MALQPWQEPIPVVGPGGKASTEWLRWLQQLLAAGVSIDTNSADVTALKSLLATLQAAVNALEAETHQSILLETNFGENGSQTQLNLVAGPNVTLSDNGAGDITISASAATAGGSALSNLVAGTLIDLFDLGGGSVQVAYDPLTVNAAAAVVLVNNAAVSYDDTILCNGDNDVVHV